MTKTGPANQLWFQNSLVTIRVSTSDGLDGLSVLEHRVPHGFSPPLHLHRNEDEVLHVLAGEFRVRVQDEERRVGAGDILLVPKGVPHTYRVESSPEGHVLSITGRGDFERFVRAVSRPAERSDLPPPAGPPSAEAIQAFAAAAAQCGIALVGPPLQ
jgi:quercetin dioxygenase-like cupin family protein